MTLETFIQQHQATLMAQLTRPLAPIETAQPVLAEAMAYALQSGGKRVRPWLLLATLHILGQDIAVGWTSAVALEYIHTYSLVHDDLPAMDDDDLRRGKPTVHRQYDEATAILVGDSLLTAAFDTIAQSPVEAARVVTLVRTLAQAAGGSGMIAGQMIDMQSAHQQLLLTELETMHRRKTGDLLVAAVELACQLAQAKPHVHRLLTQFAADFGLAFQIQNDLQDVVLTSDDTGKATGKDATLGKNTYPQLLGYEASLTALTNTHAAMGNTLDALQVQLPEAEIDLLRDFMQFVMMPH